MTNHKFASLSALMMLSAFFLVGCKLFYSPPIQVSWARVKQIYDQGHIKEFRYEKRGSWIIIILTEEAINSRKYDQEIAISNIDPKDFKMYYRTESIEAFKRKFKGPVRELIRVIEE